MGLTVEFVRYVASPCLRPLRPSIHFHPCNPCPHGRAGGVPGNRVVRQEFAIVDRPGVRASWRIEQGGPTSQNPGLTVVVPFRRVRPRGRSRSVRSPPVTARGQARSSAERYEGDGSCAGGLRGGRSGEHFSPWV